jgi:hypothetical protein
VIVAIPGIPAVGDFSSTAFCFSEGGSWATPLTPNDVTATVCGKEHFEVYK